MPAQFPSQWMDFLHVFSFLLTTLKTRRLLLSLPVVTITVFPLSILDSSESRTTQTGRQNKESEVATSFITSQMH